MEDSDQRTGAARVVSSAFALTVLGGLPVFLVGALAVQIREDLGFDRAALGWLFLIFFAVSGVGSIPAGYTVDRMGTRRSSLLGVVVSVATLLLIATVASTYAVLAVLLVIGGAANAICQLSANRSLSRAIAEERQGLSFGIKQAALPASSLVAGLAVPVVALTIGWRWAFVLACVLVVFVRPSSTRARASTLPASPAAAPPWAAPGVTQGRAALLALTIATALSAVAASSLTGFLVEASVTGGLLEPGPAGLVLALCSAVSVGVRILLGWRTDRRPDRNPIGTIVALMLIAGVGYAVLASATSPAAVIAGSVLGFGVGLGWNGLMVHLVVREHRASPATATGFVQTGWFIGSAIGPAVFGLLADGVSYAAGWAMAAACAAAAGLVAAALVVRRAVRSGGLWARTARGRRAAREST